MQRKQDSTGFTFQVSNYLKVFAVIIFLFPASLIAQNDTSNNNALNNEQILSLLSNATVSGTQSGKRWKQHFLPSGHTNYINSTGESSSGYWRTENDLFCSNWPPATYWSCYIIYLNNGKIQFKPAHGGEAWVASIAN